jgi:hypothetical protein
MSVHGFQREVGFAIDEELAGFGYDLLRAGGDRRENRLPVHYRVHPGGGHR